RSMSMLSSTCACISRSVSPPVAWISRSASVLFPSSICAMIEKFLILVISAICARAIVAVQKGAIDEQEERAGRERVRGGVGGCNDGEGAAADRQLLDGRIDAERSRRGDDAGRPAKFEPGDE